MVEITTVDDPIVPLVARVVAMTSAAASALPVVIVVFCFGWTWLRVGAVVRILDIIATTSFEAAVGVLARLRSSFQCSALRGWPHYAPYRLINFSLCNVRSTFCVAG